MFPSSTSTRRSKTTPPMIRSILTLILLLAASPAGAAVAVRILLGVGEGAAAKWDGGVTARGARITSIEPWRFDGDDAMLPGNRWKIATHPTRRFGTAVNPAARTFSANGVVVQLEGETEDSVLDVQTPQGAFTVRLNEIPLGKNKSGAAGKIVADRLPPTWRITSNPDEQDYPAAAADSSGAVWLAYLEFKHNPNHNDLRNKPNNLGGMTARTGGDQILLRKFSGGAWGEP